MSLADPNLNSKKHMHVVDLYFVYEFQHTRGGRNIRSTPLDDSN